MTRGKTPDTVFSKFNGLDSVYGVYGRIQRQKPAQHIERIFLKAYYISAGQTSLPQVQWEFYIGTFYSAYSIFFILFV